MLHKRAPTRTRAKKIACAQGNAHTLGELYAKAGAGAEFTVQGLQCAQPASGSVSSNAAIFYTLTFRCAACAALAAPGVKG